jgi:hypothetical protein
MYWQGFLRAIGMRPGFRRTRTGPGSLLHLFVAAGVGVVSGHYIFSEPLREFHAQRIQEQATETSNPNTFSGSNDNNAS